VSGPGAGYAIDPAAPAYVLAGDESALPAITSLLAALPSAAEVAVVVEAREAAAIVELPDHGGATVRWCELPAGSTPGDALVAAVVATPLVDGARVWVAGEAAAVQRIRGHLAEAGVPRSHAVVRGYWKHGREGT
jgi:NADPH-dependent ferric siderophore reductase